METHRGPLEYDWRSRFHLPLSAVGTDVMTYSEGVRLVRVLRLDPSSATTAALEGWDHGISREVLVLLDIFDLEHTVASKKPPKRHWMRPGSTDKEKQRHGNRAGRSNEQVMALLRPPI